MLKVIKLLYINDNSNTQGIQNISVYLLLINFV